MARPSKPANVIELEGKSHRTKQELEHRKSHEAALVTGKKLVERPEVKRNPVAHKEFSRIRRLLKEIGKDDEIYTGVINRYCQLYAECLAYDERREKFETGLEELETEYREGSDRLQALMDQLNDSHYSEDGEIAEIKTKIASVIGKVMEPSEYYRLVSRMQDNINKLDYLAADKRKMMLAIEKECAMTVAAALRAVPKKPEEPAKPDPMQALLGRRNLSG